MTVAICCLAVPVLNEEICLFVETDQFARNCGGVVVATVATACGGS